MIPAYLLSRKENEAKDATAAIDDQYSIKAIGIAADVSDEDQVRALTIRFTPWLSLLRITLISTS